jgi:hypothetical protein
MPYYIAVDISILFAWISKYDPEQPETHRYFIMDWRLVVKNTMDFWWQGSQGDSCNDQDGVHKFQLQFLDPWSR